MVYLFLADGFEEIEALATADILRRGGVDVNLLAVKNELEVSGAHGIRVMADALAREADFSSAQAVILPGGLPGADNLFASETVKKALQTVNSNGGFLCGICAAPYILGEYGYLKGKEAICYPGYEEKLHGAEISSKSAVRSGNVITAKAAGVSHLFAKEILSALCGADAAEQVMGKMFYE